VVNLVVKIDELQKSSIISVQVAETLSAIPLGVFLFDKQ
jgi:hypothetical protein